MPYASAATRRRCRSAARAPRRARAASRSAVTARRERPRSGSRKNARIAPASAARSRPPGPGARARGASWPRDVNDSGHVCSGAMQLDERTLSTLVAALVIAVVVLALWVAWLQRSEALLRRRLRRVIGDAEGS